MLMINLIRIIALTFLIAAPLWAAPLDDKLDAFKAAMKKAAAANPASANGRMDAMDGFELSRRAKSLKPELHIAMVSAVFVASDAAGSPIERVFEKPVAFSGLVEWLQKFSGKA